MVGTKRGAGLPGERGAQFGYGMDDLHPERVFGGGEGAVLHCCDVGARGRLDAAAAGEEVLREFRRARIQAQHVVQHQHLAGTVGAGADADGGNRQRLGDGPAQRGRHHFQHDQAGTGCFQRTRIGDQLRGGRFLAPLHLVAAELVDRLRQQTEVRAHRNAALRQEGDGVDHHRAAFQLDHVRARRHQPRGRGERALGRGLVAAEGQVGDDEGAFGAARATQRV